MNLRQMTSRVGGPTVGHELPDISHPERFLTLAMEGLALGVPEVDADKYKDFRTKVAKIALQLPDRLPDEEKLAQIRSVVFEFEEYRKSVEEEIRSRTAEWRLLTATIFRELLKSLGIDGSGPKPEQLIAVIANAASAAAVQSLHCSIDSFLHPAGTSSAPSEVSQLRVTDLSTHNDNAAGLRGGGSAVEHVKTLIENQTKGYVALFRLSCLSMIHQRFGAEAVQDCLMAVAAFLTQNLHAEDAIYHWSDSSLLAVLDGRANEQILAAELERIAFQNRETSVNIGGRAVMLRIPITFELVSLDRLQSPDDLNKITLMTTQGRR